MHELLNEKQWRQFLALEAKERGNSVLVAREAGVSKNTIKARRRELEAGDRFTPGKRMRGVGGGRKKQEEHDPSFQADLEALLDPKGDPMSLVQWTTKSAAKLKEALKQQGHQLGDTDMSKRLHALGFSLRATNSERDPRVSWLVWIGDQQAELVPIALGYALRFSQEHGYRFEKQSLLWDEPRLRTPAQFERWSHIVAIAHNHLVLARELVEAEARPWENTRRPRTPQQVRRGMAKLLPTLGTPAHPNHAENRQVG